MTTIIQQHITYKQMKEEKCNQCCWEGSNPHRCNSCCKCGTSFMPNNTFRESEDQRFDEEFPHELYDSEDEGLSVKRLITSFLHDSQRRLVETILVEINRLTPFGIGVPQDPLVSKEGVISIINQTLK